MSEITELMERYHTWLRDKTVWKTVGGGAIITAPYLDRHNDYLQVYLRKTSDGYLLTDDGETIGGLVEEGCKLDSPKRQQLLRMTLAGYGVTEEMGQLNVRATPDNFALKKHSLVQAMLAVGDMFFLAEPHVSSLFMEDLRTWLEDSEVRYSQGISFIGRSGFARRFDFLIPKSKAAPERVIKAINNPVKSSADSVIMDWLDTREVRGEDLELYAFVNDNERAASSAVLEALSNYAIVPVPWSRRIEVRAALAA